ncbi:hypothetical protein HH310_22125 [Actinoplanes sp. TBRC 11911]|uniref:hypothetical protein n=1 Tax=Actinoplanes sp. TBRC 11911 TaxID=2729386 RepID=UPI00145E617A|nr:hypothetical protein [Actinoplanes sp. TBRC 11911]NMO53867.1 hypothetical protein [Actinoplanes sp. TBRC 11911]
MTWIVLALLLLVALGACTVVVRVLRARDFGGGSGGSGSTLVRCLRCRGSGWLGGEPERTLNFTQGGFENRHTPATQCPACGGTGSVTR